MHKSNLKITILTDKSSWFNKFSTKLKDEFENLGYTVCLISSKKNIEKGDIAFFLSCFEIIEQEFLRLNKNNIVVHASDLPEGKGWSPMSWQILEGKNEIPITLFEANEKCDGGDYYTKDKLILNGDELIYEWQEKLGLKIVEMCVRFVNNFQNIKPLKQSGKETFYKRRTPKDSELDINKTIKEQFNLLRVVDNNAYPAFFVYNDEKYIISIKKEK